jgi:hypothetical protein
MLKAMAERLRSFVEGTDHVALIVGSPAGDALPLLKIFEEVETSSASDLFWTFTDAFADAPSYTSAVVAAFATQHEVMREAMEAEGMEPWPAIPAEVTSERTPPAQRLRTLAALSRELLPVPNGGNNVWVFYPLEVHDPAGFATLVAEVLAHEFPFPWCHHLRFIVRDDPGTDDLVRRLTGWPRIDWWRPDLSREAVDKALDAQVADDAAPLAERMGALLMSAGSDLATNQPDAALEKYELLLRYHAPMDNHPMAAVALNGMGESYEKLGQPEQAEAAYHAALIPASDGDPPSIPVLLNVVMNLANMRMGQERWAESEGYWDATQQLAAASRNAPLRIEALDRRGICQELQGKYAEAEESWNAGCIMAAKIEDAQLTEALLGRLEGFYQRMGRENEARGVGKMLEEMKG